MLDPFVSVPMERPTALACWRTPPGQGRMCVAADNDLIAESPCRGRRKEKALKTARLHLRERCPQSRLPESRPFKGLYLN